jgi:hypothetical protein
MFTGSILSRSKGFILPVALILMAFATTMILTAGVMLQRTSSKLNSYSLLSDLRIASNNLVESATMELADKWSTADLFVSEWSDYDKFHSFVSSRGGYEGTLWAKAIEELDDDSWWLINNDPDFKAILDDDAFSEFENKGAVINRTGNKYSIVSWVEKGGVIRYSYGLAMTESLAGLAALTLGELSRVFYEVTTVGTDSDELANEFGDLINGAAAIFSQVFIHGNDETITKIFPFGLTAESVHAYPTDEDIEFSSYTATDTANKEDYFKGLYSAFEQWLQTLTIQGTYAEPSSNKKFSVTVEDEDHLLVFGSPNGSFTKDYSVSFPGNTTDNEVVVSYEYDKSKYEITISGDEVPVNLLFHGNVAVVGNAQQKNYVNGRYDITAYGDILLETNLLYGDFSTEIASATGNQGGTLTNPIETWTSVKTLLTEFAGRPDADYVVFKALGGDIINYLDQGTSTHGIRALAGDYYALKDYDTGDGGSFLFPDVATLQNIKKGQFYIFGSLTGNRFDPHDELRNIYNLFVSSPQNTDGGDSTTRRLVLMGLRAW